MSLFGCDNDPLGIEGDDGLGNNAVKNESGLVRFSYNYDGTIGANSYNYSIEKDETVKMTYQAMEAGDEELELEVDEKLLDRLYELYDKHKVYRWDGYSKYAKYVSDGSGFSLSLRFKDGKSMYVHGMNCSPDGFREFMNEVNALVNPYIEQVKQNRIDARIAEGIKGDLNTIMANFLQKGTSGSDNYDFLIMREGYRENNVDVTIKSVSGDFIEPGNYRYYGHLSNEEIGFDKVKEIAEKYELIRWFDYDKAAEDYNNAEWFQIMLDFDDSHISAMGTEHPENYDEFREEVIKYLISMLEEHPELKQS